MSYILTLIALFFAPLERLHWSPVQAEAMDYLGGRTVLLRFRLTDLFMILAWISLFVSRKKIAIPFGHFWKMLYGVVLLMVLSTFRAHDVDESLKQVLQYAVIFFIQLTLCIIVFQDISRIRAGILCLSLGFMIVLAGSFFAYFTVGRIDELGHLSSDSNFYGIGGLSRSAYLSLPFFLYFLYFGWNKKANLWIPPDTERSVTKVAGKDFSWNFSATWVVFLGLGATFSFLAGDRAGLVSYAAVLVLFAGLYFASLRGKNNYRKLSIFLGLVLSAYLFIFQNALSPDFRRKLERPFVYLTEDRTLASRLNTYRAVFSSLPETLVLGWGLDPINIRRGIEDYTHVYTNNPIPHNMFLYWWSGSGFLSMALMILCFLYWYYRLWSVYRSNHSTHEERILGICFMTAISGFLLHHMLHASSLNRTEWFIFGLGLALSEITRNRMGQDQPMVFKTRVDLLKTESL